MENLERGLLPSLQSETLIRLVDWCQMHQWLPTPAQITVCWTGLSQSIM